MASAEVELILDDGHRLRFAHSPLKAFFFTLVALGFTWVCWRFIPPEEAIRNVAIGFSLIFVAAGVFGMFWRMDLDIDLAQRRVRIRRGLWPAPTTRERALDAADGVWLHLKYRSSGSKGNKTKVPYWVIAIKFPEDKKGTRIHVAADELQGYQKWEYYAKRLQLDAVDNTEKKAERSAWDSLDKSVAEQAAESSEPTLNLPNQPLDSAIATHFTNGFKEFVIPALGFNAGLVFLLLFGGAFVALGGGALLGSLGIIDMEVQGSEWALRIVPPIFILVGLGIAWLSFKSSYTATIVGADGNSLFTESFAFGKRSGRKSIPINSIEAIAVGGDVRSRGRSGGRVRVGGMTLGREKYRKRDHEIVVRSDSDILRFGDELSEQDRDWLAGACRYASVKGRLP